ncbi:dnaJ homolog subfamily C member 2-like [Prunus yedoensis var. nudiflora]|uniref:DnaJ homolog subfamily C member 2-like n=1 Tax=Prunus yedoensis var. nudiflora TaxID=2094558 RepID=A0A314U8R9_PRUYE|nr:dnaJ homolog subfamily C member 2-like [Prunus yedoensis var. nudiflora]
MLKFPKGTSRRWEVVSDYIGTGRSVEEILKATKTVLLQKPDSSKAFDSFLEKRKPAPSIASPLTTRIEVEGVLTPPQGTATPAEKVDKSGESSSGSTKTKILTIQLLKMEYRQVQSRMYGLLYKKEHWFRL